MTSTKLDEKDLKILRELDINYRTPFTQIAKKVKLSKNAVIKRFENKLRHLVSHASIGFNHEKIGYKMIKVYYSLNYYDEEIEKKIIEVVKDHQNIIWVARYYGPFDISIALLVKDFNQLMIHLNEFNESLLEVINNKRIELISKQFYFRHEYIHKNPTKKIQIYENYNGPNIKISKADKKIITSIINEPRKNIIQISEETGLNTKTVTSRIKDLEKKGIITGYFPTFNNTELKYDTFKLMIQIRGGKDSKKFEEYLMKIRNIKHIRKMIGYWDYEIDMIYQSNDELHKEIEEMKKAFPRLFKKIDIASFEKRIFTNKKEFLFED